MKWKKGEPQNRKIETLADKIRGVAYESIENIWNAFLDLEGLDMVRAMEKDPRLLVSHGNYIGAMKVLEGIYALVEIALDNVGTKRLMLKSAAAHMEKI